MSKNKKNNKQNLLDKEMVTEQINRFNKEFFIIIGVAIVLVIIFAEREITGGFKPALNAYTTIHFLNSMALGAIMNNLVLFTIGSIFSEIFEFAVCVPLEFCLPPEITRDTILDLLVNQLGYLMGLTLFKPEKKSLIEDLIIVALFFLFLAFIVSLGIIIPLIKALF